MYKLKQNMSILDVNLFSFSILWEKLRKEGILHLQTWCYLLGNIADQHSMKVESVAGF